MLSLWSNLLLNDLPVKRHLGFPALTCTDQGKFRLLLVETKRRRAKRGDGCTFPSKAHHCLKVMQENCFSPVTHPLPLWADRTCLSYRPTLHRLWHVPTNGALQGLYTTDRFLFWSYLGYLHSFMNSWLKMDQHTLAKIGDVICFQSYRLADDWWIFLRF